MELINSVNKYQFKQFLLTFRRKEGLMVIHNMRKKSISTSVDEDIYFRLQQVAEKADRSFGSVIRICVKRGLPEIEAEVFGTSQENPTEHKTPRHRQ